MFLVGYIAAPPTMRFLSPGRRPPRCRLRRGSGRRRRRSTSAVLRTKLMKSSRLDVAPGIGSLCQLRRSGAPGCRRRITGWRASPWRPRGRSAAGRRSARRFQRHRKRRAGGEARVRLGGQVDADGAARLDQAERTQLSPADHPQFPTCWFRLVNEAGTMVRPFRGGRSRRRNRPGRR